MFETDAVSQSQQYTLVLAAFGLAVSASIQSETKFKLKCSNSYPWQVRC